MRDRKNKIKLLNELSKGKKSISELNPPQPPIILMHNTENPNLICETSVFRGEPGKCYTIAEFEEMKRKNPKEFKEITLNLGDTILKNTDSQ